MPEPEKPPEPVERIGGNNRAALVEYGGDPEENDFHEPVTVNIDQLYEFVEECRSMGWGNVRLYVHDNSVVLGRGQGESGDMFIGLAPMVVDGNEVPGDD